VNDEIQARLRARRSLARARRDFDEGDYDFAVSGGHYAMFYAAEALMISRGLTFARHSGVIAAINREFVRTGQLEPAHYEAFEAAFRERNTADYGFETPVSREAAARILAHAAAFVQAAESRLPA
jgi:uncharacterized protein (UPF0332 family)